VTAPPDGRGRRWRGVMEYDTPTFDAWPVTENILAFWKELSGVYGQLTGNRFLPDFG